MNSIQKMLLERAEREYLPSVQAISAVTGAKFTPSGRFSVDDQNSVYSISEQDGNFCVYNAILDKWAHPFDEPSLLSGKCAIQVNNEREFKLLMKHYDDKGWKNCEGHTDSVSFFNEAGVIEAVYGDGYSYVCKGGAYDSHAQLGFNIIPFDQFAAEVGIKIPVFVMTSEDGVPLYEGDDYHRVYFNSEWEYKGFVGNPTKSENNPAYGDPAHNKAFSTREAAESWIADQNKPKTISLGWSYGSINVTRTTIEFNLNYPLEKIELSGKFFDKISRSRHELQQQSDKN